MGPGASARRGRWGGWTRSFPPPGIAHVQWDLGVVGWPCGLSFSVQRNRRTPTEAGNRPHDHTDASVAAAKASSRKNSMAPQTETHQQRRGVRPPRPSVTALKRPRAK